MPATNACIPLSIGRIVAVNARAMSEARNVAVCPISSAETQRNSGERVSVFSSESSKLAITIDDTVGTAPGDRA